MPRCEPCRTPTTHTVRGCRRCGAHDQHRHLQLIDRRGNTRGNIVLCATCLSTLTWRDTTLLDEFQRARETA